jgi:hypothetical protein
MTGLMPSLIPSPPTAKEKPRAETFVEGELSPFEHEALYRILRKGFQTEHPSYQPILDEEISTRVNIVFHHEYSKSIFTDILHEDWRELKELFKQITYRRGKAGAAFSVSFATSEVQIIFKTGSLEQRDLSSALDQIGHLTGIVGYMVRPETMEKPLRTIKVVYDRRSDRWHNFEGSTPADEKYVFDDTVYRWVRS